MVLFLKISEILLTRSPGSEPCGHQQLFLRLLVIVPGAAIIKLKNTHKMKIISVSAYVKVSSFFLRIFW